MVHAALDAGVTLIDTADAYARDESEFGHNEALVATRPALLRRRHATSWWRPRAGTPAGARLGAGRVAGLPAPGVRGVAAPAARRGDRALPVPPARPGDAVGGVDGRAAVAGRRRPGADGRASRTPTSRRSTRPGRSSATRWSACRTSSRRASGPRPPSWRTARRVGLAWLPWSPFGGVSAAGSLDADGAGVRRGGRRARRLGVPGDAGVALAQADVVVPIPGASRPESIVDSAAAADLTLSPEHLARLNAP